MGRIVVGKHRRACLCMHVCVYTRAFSAYALASLMCVLVNTRASVCFSVFTRANVSFSVYTRANVCFSAYTLAALVCV